MQRPYFCLPCRKNALYGAHSIKLGSTEVFILVHHSREVSWNCLQGFGCDDVVYQSEKPCNIISGWIGINKLRSRDKRLFRCAT